MPYGLAGSSGNLNMQFPQFCIAGSFFSFVRTKCGCCQKKTKCGCLGRTKKAHNLNMFTTNCSFIRDLCICLDLLIHYSLRSFPFASAEAKQCLCACNMNGYTVLPTPYKFQYWNLIYYCLTWWWLFAMFSYDVLASIMCTGECSASLVPDSEADALPTPSMIQPN